MPIASSVAEVAHLLGVPREREHVEAVEELDEPGGPVGVVHVDHVDARPRPAARRGAPAARRGPLPARRVHEVHLGRRARRARPGRGVLDEHSQRRSAAPAAGRHLDQRPCRRRGRRGRARARSRCPARRRGRPGGARRARPAAAAVRLRRPAGGASPARATASWTSTTSPSALRRASDSRPRAPQLQRPAEGRQGVLGLVGAGAPVGEGDRAVTDRLLPHVAPSAAGSSSALGRAADAC